MFQHVRTIYGSSYVAGILNRFKTIDPSLQFTTYLKSAIGIAIQAIVLNLIYIYMLSVGALSMVDSSSLLRSAVLRCYAFLELNQEPLTYDGKNRWKNFGLQVAW